LVLFKITPSFHQEQAAAVADGNIIPAGSSESEGESEDDSSSESEGEESEDEPMVDCDPEEAEKQYKREKVVRKAFHSVFKRVDQFSVEEIPEKLMEVNVKNFTPQMCGYASLRGFAKNQPKTVFRYSKTTGVIQAPKS